MATKSELKASTANITPKATKLPDDNAPISNPHNEAQKAKEANAVQDRKTATNTALDMMHEANRYADNEAKAGGAGRAIAIVDLVLMHKHKLALGPTRDVLKNKEGTRASFGKYLEETFRKISVSYTEMIGTAEDSTEKKPHIDTLWRQALKGWVFLYNHKCLVTNLDPEKHGKHAKQGISIDSKGRHYIAVELEHIAGLGIEIGGYKVKQGETGTRMASATDIISWGEALLGSDKYFKKAQPTETKLSTVDAFIAFCREITEGKKTIDDETLQKLRNAIDDANKAITKMEEVKAVNAANTEKFIEEKEAKGEPTNVTIMKAGPKPKAQTMRPAKKQRKAA